MSIYTSISTRLKDEQTQKKIALYVPNDTNNACFRYFRVTRFFKTNEVYPCDAYAFTKDAPPNQPTMFTPWSKVLSTQDNYGKNHEPAYFSKALGSIIAQLIYDVFYTIYYAFAFFPSFFMFLIETNKTLQQEQQESVQKKYLGNMFLLPYFAIAIIIDFLREFCALFTRTYATLVQTSEERNTPYAAVG